MRSAPAPNWIHPWRLITLGIKGKGEIIAANPKINQVSQIIEPTALPKARPGLPLIAAKTETAASGRVVPKLTMVAPIKILGIPQRREILTASSTNKSAPLPRMIINTAMTRKSSHKGKTTKS